MEEGRQKGQEKGEEQTPAHCTHTCPTPAFLHRLLHRHLGPYHTFGFYPSITPLTKQNRHAMAWHGMRHFCVRLYPHTFYLLFIGMAWNKHFHYMAYCAWHAGSLPLRPTAHTHTLPTTTTLLHTALLLHTPHTAAPRTHAHHCTLPTHPRTALRGWR